MGANTVLAQFIGYKEIRAGIPAVKIDEVFVIKDFLWLLIKDNIVINFVYIKIFPVFFIKKTLSRNSIKKKLTTKEELKQRSKPKGLYLKGFTSGTTNSPLTVYRSFSSILLEEYVFKTYTYKNGVPLSPSIAVIRGDMVKDVNDLSSPYWVVKPFTRRLVMSSFHLSPESIPFYLDKLQEFKPDMIMAYPSSITLIAREAVNIGWSPDWEFKGVFTSSETFSPEDKELVKKVFGHIFDHYGQAERVAVMQTCSSGYYHVREDYSKVDFENDENGLKIVGTNYYNSAMPIDRYDTGDYVKGYESSKLCKCGDKSPYVTQIIGRDDDYLLLSDGRKVGRLDVAFKDIKGLFACQIEQASYQKILVKFVCEEGVNTEVVSKDILLNLQVRLGSTITIECQSVLSIPRTKAGKFKSVIRAKEL